MFLPRKVKPLHGHTHTHFHLSPFFLVAVNSLMRGSAASATMSASQAAAVSAAAVGHSAATAATSSLAAAAAHSVAGLGATAADVKGAVSAASAAAAAMQFPLAQRRKRRILFTQAQVKRKVSFKVNLKVRCEGTAL